MISEVAERAVCISTLRNDTLHVLTLEGIGADVPLKLGESLLEARIEVNMTRRAVLSRPRLGSIARRTARRKSKRAACRTCVDLEVLPNDVGGTGECTVLTITLATDFRQMPSLKLNSTFE